MATCPRDCARLDFDDLDHLRFTRNYLLLELLYDLAPVCRLGPPARPRSDPFVLKPGRQSQLNNEDDQQYVASAFAFPALLTCDRGMDQIASALSASESRQASPAAAASVGGIIQAARRSTATRLRRTNRTVPPTSRPVQTSMFSPQGPTLSNASPSAPRAKPTRMIPMASFARLFMGFDRGSRGFHG